MPNGIMDGFFKKVNQKVNLGHVRRLPAWHLSTHLPGFWKTHPKIRPISANMAHSNVLNLQHSWCDFNAKVADDK